MPGIVIHHDKIKDPAAAAGYCPFGALEIGGDGRLVLGAGCRLCRICLKHPDGLFTWRDDSAPAVDKSQWRGVAVAAELVAGRVHPVSFELIGKARELAGVIDHPVLGLVIGHKLDEAAGELLEYGVDELFVYDAPEYEHFRIEPYAAAFEDFIHRAKPSSVLVGGTPTGRSLAPRVAARFRTGLTADCTRLGMAASTDLDQIRPAYGGDIMAHINTPNHRPQFATVRYKIFPIPAKTGVRGKITRCAVPKEKLQSAIEALDVRPKAGETGIEDAEVLVVAGRALRKREDMALIEELAAALGGMVAGTRSLIEAGWLDPRRQIGLSGRTVKPKLIVTCGVSGAIQFVAGMDGAECIVAINTDPAASIFNIAHIGIEGDLYHIVPGLIARIRAGGEVSA